MSLNKNRALWLINHSTLRPFEVPLLIEMGYEVYCPKMFPYDEGNMSASIDYSYDKTLSIPAEVLEIFNQVDFYKQVPRNILDLMNEYFDVVFFGFFPEQLKMLVDGFEGVLVMQPFGLATNVTYTKVIEQTLGISFLQKLEKLGDRFFFGQAYENLAEIEYRYFRNRAVYLPLGLKDAYVNDKWVGGDNRILFVCPRINTSSYFRNIYRTFQENFKGFNYVVGGAQPIEVTDDKNVVGYIPKEQYEYNMSHLAVMFYHSQEKRHVHYHPLEAVKQGMPLVFMEGGLLESIAGRKLPGCCKSIKEARHKIKRIMRGDRGLIKEIKESQEILLKPFQYEYCKEQWRKEFIQIEESIKKNRNRAVLPKKVAILLPEAYTGGVLDYTLRFVKSMVKGIQEEQSNVEVVFGYIDHEVFLKKDYFNAFREMGIAIRPFNWKVVTEDYLNTVMKYKGWDKEYSPGEYCMPDDGGYFFEDCDYIILSIDRVPLNFFTTKPYAVVVHDYIQRYLPEQYGTFYEKCVIDLQRGADAVIVMTQPTLEDGIQYAGLRKEKLKLTPLMFDAIREDEYEKAESKKKYFLWSTNLGKHKNHLRALTALSEYYARGGKLCCYMTGVGTKDFNPKEKYEGNNEYVIEVRNQIRQDACLQKNIVFCGNMDKKKYYSVLKGACFFMHPGFTDNGNMTAIDAAFLRVPTITSDYPAMRYYEEKMGLNMKFFNPFNPKELADLLLQMDDEYKVQMQKLPSYECLERYTIEHTYKELYDTIKDIFEL